MSEKRKANLIRQSGPRAQISWVCLLLSVVFLAFLAHRIGMLGMAFFAMPYLLCRILLAAFGNTAKELIKRRVALYRSRNAFQNAVGFYHGITATVFLIGLLIAAGLFVASDRICLFISMTRLSSLGLKLFALSILPLVLMRCMDGYLEGMGAYAPGAVAQNVGILTALAAALLCSGKIGSYSEKIAALMRTDHYYYAYMAALGSGSILLGSVVGLLVLVFFNGALKKSLRQLYDGGFVKNKVSYGEVLSDYAGWFTGAVLKEIYPLAGLFIVTLMALKKQGSISESLGSFMTGAILVTQPTVMLARQLSSLMSRQMERDLKHDDRLHACERMAIHLKVLNYLLFPYLTVLLTLAPTIGKTLFDTEDKLFVAALMWGVLSALLCSLLLFATGAVSAAMKKWVENLLLLAGLMVSCLVGMRYMAQDEFGFQTVWVVCLMGHLVVLVLESGLIVKSLNFHQDLLRSFLLIGVSNVVMGLITFVLQRFTASLSAWLVLALGLVLGLPAYITCIVMTHTFDIHEWSAVPGKELPLGIARWLKLY